MVKTTIASLLNDPVSRRRILEKAAAECGKGGLLDLLPSYGTDGKALETEPWENIGRQPEAREIDYSRTPMETILQGKAILKGGRRVYWE